jgi:hypothetical protein
MKVNKQKLNQRRRMIIIRDKLGLNTNLVLKLK